MTEGDVPYSTTDNEAEWYGHIWRQRDGDLLRGQWGFAWAVIPPYETEAIASGWRKTYAEAEKAMRKCLEAKKGKPCQPSE